MTSTVTYHAPTIGPKFYTARGSSGWVESFPRERADRELQTFLGSVPVKTAVDGFRAQMKLTSKKGIDWSMILDYLMFIAQTKRTNLITDGAGVAFWCKVIESIQAETEQKVN